MDKQSDRAEDLNQSTRREPRTASQTNVDQGTSSRHNPAESERTPSVSEDDSKANADTGRAEDRVLYRDPYLFVMALVANHRRCQKDGLGTLWLRDGEHAYPHTLGRPEFARWRQGDDPRIVFSPEILRITSQPLAAHREFEHVHEFLDRLYVVLHSALGHEAPRPECNHVEPSAQVALSGALRALTVYALHFEELRLGTLELIANEKRISAVSSEKDFLVHRKLCTMRAIFRPKNDIRLAAEMHYRAVISDRVTQGSEIYDLFGIMRHIDAHKQLLFGPPNRGGTPINYDDPGCLLHVLTTKDAALRRNKHGSLAVSTGRTETPVRGLGYAKFTTWYRAKRRHITFRPPTRLYRRNRGSRTVSEQLCGTGHALLDAATEFLGDIVDQIRQVRYSDLQRWRTLTKSVEKEPNKEVKVQDSLDWCHKYHIRPSVRKCSAHTGIPKSTVAKTKAWKQYRDSARRIPKEHRYEDQSNMPAADDSSDDRSDLD